MFVMYITLYLKHNSYNWVCMTLSQTTNFQMLLKCTKEAMFPRPLHKHYFVQTKII